jgi:protein subunit release factor B
MEPVESQVTIKIDPKELNEQFTKALDEQKNIDKRLGDLGEKLVQETRESRKKSLETRIEKLRSEKLELDSKVELMKAQKVQIEQESQQKTEEHDEKMKALKKVNEDLNEE